MSTKQCTKCKAIKPLSEFNIKNRARGRWYAHCKKCRQKWYEAHMQTNPELRGKYKEHNKNAADKIHTKILEYLKDHPCVDCGEADPVVLKFDHISGTKEMNMSALIRRKRNWDRVVEEINKCEIRCGNCHDRRHAKERNHYRYSGV